MSKQLPEAEPAKPKRIRGPNRSLLDQFRDALEKQRALVTKLDAARCEANERCGAAKLEEQRMERVLAAWDGKSEVVP